VQFKAFCLFASGLPLAVQGQVELPGRVELQVGTLLLCWQLLEELMGSFARAWVGQMTTMIQATARLMDPMNDILIVRGPIAHACVQYVPYD
jgi:hypothetical protein